MILAFKLFLLAWLVVHFEPLQDFLQRMYNIIIIKKVSKHLMGLIDAVHLILGCFKCASFWFVLVFGWNLWFAIGASMLASVWMRFISK